jgi:hypothetical protein
MFMRTKEKSLTASLYSSELPSLSDGFGGIICSGISRSIDVLLEICARLWFSQNPTVIRKLADEIIGSFVGVYHLELMTRHMEITEA